MDVSGYFKSLVDVGRCPRSLTDVSGYLILVKFSGIVRSVKSSRFLRYKIDINKNLRLSKFFKFQFRVKVVHYKTFLLAIGGSK